MHNDAGSCLAYSPHDVEEAARAEDILRIATIGHRFPDDSVEREALRGTGIEVLFLGGLAKDTALERAAQAHAVLIGVSFSLNADDLKRLENCRAIVRYGVGVDNVDVRAAHSLGITVSNVPDYGIEEVATHALALLLLFARGLGTWAEAVRAGQWGSALPKVRLSRLSNTTLGIIGAGRIGRALLVRARPIWGRILVFDPWVSVDEIAAMGAEKASLEDLLADSDFVSIHVPLSDDTKGMISRERLQLLKRGAVLVNCSRGDVVDEKALQEYIGGGKIAGAGLDVFASEPPEPNGIASLPQVWPTPHVAWLSQESIRDLRYKAAEEAGCILLGKGPRHPISPA